MPERSSSPYVPPRALRSRAIARGATARARARAVPLASRIILGLLAPLWAFAAPARAGSGTGTAVILPSGSVLAGSTGTWNVTYMADEDFSNSGGVIEIVIPSGWTLPQKTSPTSAGYVSWTDTTLVDSVAISGATIRVFLGAPPGPKFRLGDALGVLYGVGGGPASAHAQTSAPASPVFLVRSDPAMSGGPAPIAASPSLSVVPGPVVSVKVVDGGLAPVGALSLTADQDTTRLYLHGYDAFGNPVRPVSGTWTLTGGIGAPAPASATSTVLTLTDAGAGYAVADSGAWADSTGLITVAHGAYAALGTGSAAVATAGAPFAASATALDSDGNVITSGPGSGASVTFVAYADSTGSATADPDLVDPTSTLAAGVWNGTLTARRAGTYYLAGVDSASGFTSPRRRLDITPGAPDRIALSPDTLHLVAGAPESVSVHVFDAYGNRAPVLAPEELTLWTDRPAGAFQDLTGTPIFDLTIAAGADSARFRFRDTQTTGPAGRIRGIDANGAAPFLGTSSAAVFTAPDAPAGTIVLAATPDTLAADGVDSLLVVSAVVRDAYGNPVAPGERFTFGGTLLTPITDQDPAAPMAQLLADGTGTLSGFARAGTVSGPGSVSITSERGTASGAAAVRLLSGIPAGAIALSAPADSLAADSAATLEISASGLTDASGNRVKDGEAYTLSATLGSIATPDEDPATPGIQTLASGGAIAFLLFGGDVLGTAHVDVGAVRGASAGSLDVRLVTGGPNTIRSSVTAESPVPVGPGGSIVSVTLRDAQSHPIAGVPVESLTVQIIGIPAFVTPLGTATDGAGRLDFRATATAAGGGSAGVIALGITLIQRPAILFTPGPLDHYTVSGPAGPLNAGTSVDLAVAAFDGFGNPLPGRSGDVLRPRVVTGGANLPDSVVLAAGAATLTVLPTLASALTVLVADDSSRSATYGPAAVNPGPPYRVTALPASRDTLAAGDTLTVRALVADAHGNAAPGSGVNASVAAGSGSVAPGSALADGSGLASYTVTAGGTPGPLSVRFEAPGSAAPDSIRADSLSITVVAGVAVSIAVLAPAAGAAGDSLAVTLTLLDGFGNRARGAAPSIWVRTTTAVQAPDHVAWIKGPLAQGALEDTVGSDGARYDFAPGDSGAATILLRDTLAETIRLRASGPGIPAAESGDLTVLAAPPASLALVSGDAQTGIVARELGQPLRVRARDAFGNATAGASVVFRVQAGSGAVDATRGGAPDSIALADPAGVATCDVARLGTLAGSASDLFSARLSAAPAPQVTFTASALPDTAASLAMTPASLALAPTQSATVTVTARDLFGNPAPSTAVTVYLGSPISGSLESLGGTAGGPGSQSGVTDATGRLAVRYVAPALAPAADSIFARGSFIGPSGIGAATSAGPTAALRVLPDTLSWIAGGSVRVRVQAVDAFGNLVPTDAASVAMRPSGGLAWSPAAGPLVAGEFVTFGRDTLAESIAIGADRVGGGGGSGGTAVVSPALPSGPIPIAATRDTLTADGRSAATVTLGPVRDSFGNLVVTGSLIGVGALAGALLASDASPLYPGLDLATGSDGRASLLIVAPAAAGPDTLTAASRMGAAAGSKAFMYVPAPSIAYVAGTLAPVEVLPGASAALSLGVRNTGTVTIRLETGSQLSFGSGPSAYTASLAAPVVVPAGGTASLAFSASAVPASLTPGVYAPSLHATGTDGQGAAFDFYPSLAGAQVSVLGVGVAAVSAAPDPAPLGYPDLRLVFDVTNRSGTPGALVGGSIAYTAGAFVPAGPPTPALPETIPAGGTTRFTFPVRVPASGLPSGTIVGATLHATVSFAGAAVVDSSVAALTFRVVSAAQIAAIPGSAAPARLLRGRTAGPSVRVANTGASAVTLDRGATRLVLDRGAGVLAAALSANTAVAAGDQATLVFDSLAVPGGTPKGRYRARLFLSGTESGQAFADTVPLAPDSIDVLDPAILAFVPGSLQPDTVSAGQTRPLSLALRNVGDVPFLVDAATALALGAPLNVTRTLGSGATIGPGQTAALSFTGGALGSPVSPGVSAATLEIFGREDLVPRAETLSAGALDAEPPAQLRFVPGTTRPAQARAGTTVDLTLDVENTGGSPITLDPAASRLQVTDGVDALTALAAGPPVTVAPGGATTLSFPAAAIPAAMASQAYRVDLTLQNSEWGLADSARVSSPDGEFTLLEPAAALQVRDLDAASPVQVAPGAGLTRAWALELTPLRPPGVSSSVSLTSIRLAVLSDGSTAAPPAAAVGSIALRDGAGSIVAQTTPSPGAPNPVTLALSVPLSLASGAESLWVDVALKPGATATRVALRIENGADVVALDNLTATQVQVLGAGGLAFTPLTSPDLTLFAKAHGYPNPFRAGSEAVRLSYVLREDAPVKVSIYTLLGGLVREIAVPAGAAGGSIGLNELPWDGKNGSGELVRPGVYVAEIQGGSVSERIKVGVLR